MVDNLIAKQANIAHTELPEALIPGQKRKRETEQEEEKKNDTTADYGKMPHKVEVHPLLKAKFKTLFQSVPTVNFLKLAHFCNTNFQAL
eukprot:5290561-Ditylum_brightwellii.AAC.1